MKRLAHSLRAMELRSTRQSRDYEELAAILEGYFQEILEKY